MKLTIKITKEVLEAAKYCEGLVSQSCGVAVAVREIFPNANVGHETMMFDHMNAELGYTDLPLRAQRFICEFDARKPHERIEMRETSFEIEIPDSVIEKIGIEEAKEIISKSSTLELVQ